jgi:hypothetical protein
MCQISKTQKMHQIKKDRIVYKVVVPTEDNNVFRAEFNDYFYQLGEMKQIEKKEILKSVRKQRKGYEFYCGFHSFIYLRDAKEWASYLQRVVKCIIPKGSYVSKGSLECGIQETLISDRIVLIGIV